GVDHQAPDPGRVGRPRAADLAGRAGGRRGGVHRLERARGAPRASHRGARAARAGAADASDGAGGERGGQSGARARRRLKAQDRVGACSVTRAPAEEARLSIEPIAPLAELTAVPSGCPAFRPAASAPTLPARASRGEKSLRSTALAGSAPAARRNTAASQ